MRPLPVRRLSTISTRPMPVESSLPVIGCGLVRGGGLTACQPCARSPDVAPRLPRYLGVRYNCRQRQIRNMASLGGNRLHVPAAVMFPIPPIPIGNKRRTRFPGCASLEGNQPLCTRFLGIGELCIAPYPGDFAQALDSSWTLRWKLWG